MPRSKHGRAASAFEMSRVANDRGGQFLGVEHSLYGCVAALNAPLVAHLFAICRNGIADGDQFDVCQRVQGAYVASTAAPTAN